MSNIILLSEFQPLHKEREKPIIEATKNSIKNILFCIDGAYRKIHADSPFSTQQREEMIHILMKDYDLPYNITHLRDTDNIEDRINSISKLLQPVSGSTVISDDPATYRLLQGSNIDTQFLGDPEDHIQSTIRNQFAAQSSHEAEKKLPTSVFNYLQGLDTAARMKKLKTYAFWGPNIAVDIVVYNDKGEIAIIERMNEPFGAALPGGMIERGDTGPETAYKESDEEINAKGELQQSPNQSIINNKIITLAQKYNIPLSGELQPFTAQTSPTRDMRGHIMTLGYTMYYNGELSKGSDAKSVKWMKPEDALLYPRIPNCHKEIILSYIAQNKN